VPSARPGHGSGARPLGEAGAVRCRFSRSDCRLLNLLLPRAWCSRRGGRFEAAPRLFGATPCARRVRRAPLRAGRRLLREILGHFGSASPLLFGFIRLRARLVLASWEYPSPFYCLIIWLYLDAEVLVLPPVFLPQDSVFVGRRLRCQPTPARPFPSFFSLGWCGLSRAGFLSFPAPFSLRVSISQSTGILGIPLLVLLSNI